MKASFAPYGARVSDVSVMRKARGTERERVNGGSLLFGKMIKV